MVELSVDLNLGKRSVEDLFCFLFIGAGFDFDDFDGIEFVIVVVLRLVDFREAARTDQPKVLELGPESLNRWLSTSFLAIFWKSKPSIVIIRLLSTL